jgi:hypothetical protein
MNIFLRSFNFKTVLFCSVGDPDPEPDPGDPDPLVRGTDPDPDPFLFSQRC